MLAAPDFGRLPDPPGHAAHDNIYYRKAFRAMAWLRMPALVRGMAYYRLKDLP